ncbi:serine/threonine-protein kinase LMTK1 isoform X3 [Erinaceus europaeus]|nr:serine/threonine-protein kinase LMTK1 isoform X3 [Erinaceus europaeus]
MQRVKSMQLSCLCRAPPQQCPTVLTCTSCHSLRSPCPWPSSQGAQEMGCFLCLSAPEDTLGSWEPRIQPPSLGWDHQNLCNPTPATLGDCPYSWGAAAQVCRPGPTQPAVPGGDRPWLVWEGVSGGGELGAEQHAGTGEGAAGQCQCAGADALPGGGPSLQAGGQPVGSCRALKHDNLLQCLAQCAEVTPYLLVMEFCPMGDLKGYLRSCRVAESMAPDPLTLQRMACEVSCGVLHLHRHNYVHSDLALRNCLLTADLTVKVGDYGLSHSKYREDYFVTADQLWVPLRWMAPELVDEVHSNLLVAGQTKASNVWSLGVTLWELFELGTQPYPQHSDRQVLAYTVREQQLKLPRPQLSPTLSDRWYEVMQFCWLQPEQRPTAEEVHLLLTYLCTQGTSEVEEDFERRWRSMRPGGGGLESAGLALGVAGELAAASSFPLLEQFAGDGFHGDGDDVLTVTETSRGLNFEYNWETGRGAEAFPPLGAVHLQEPGALDGAPPGVVPVLSAHSPSVGSEYFIRLEEPASTAGHHQDCAGCAPRPRRGSQSPSDAGDPDDDSDGSASASLAMEPLLGRPPPSDDPWGGRYLRGSLGQPPPWPSRSPSPEAQMLQSPRAEDLDWGAVAFCPPFLEDLPSTPPTESPGGKEQRATRGSRAASHRHWTSNVSANNNSGQRSQECSEPSFSRGCVDCCPDSEQPPWASPELHHPLAMEDSRESLLRLQEVVTCLVTPPWTEDGGHGDPPELRLTEEAEGPSGPPLPLPSIPSPSQEGAPLPAEEAGAPTTLPASPTPATEPAGPQDSGSNLLELEASGSEDEDATEATPGIFTDLSSDGPQPERPSMVPALRSLQKQAGTPDSLDSLDIPSSVSSGAYESCSPSAMGTPGVQPRALDSGYDTENYESPEFVLKEAHESGELGAFGEQISEGQSPGPETQLSTLPGGLNEKNPYRDSAYFSDLDTEPELPCAPETPDPELELGSPQGPATESERISLEAGVHEEGLPLPLPREASPEPGPDPTLPPPRPPSPAQELPVVPSLGGSIFLLSPVTSAENQEAPGLLSPVALQNRIGAPSRAPLCLALPAAPEGRPKEEDNDDSDESDEELSCYNMQEPSEDSEEEAPVPVVVAERQSAHNLRSLLKMPSLLTQAFCEDLERKKKAVSFFDDVTVYLFDQESPTREAGEPLLAAKEPAPTFLAGSSGALGRPRQADNSREGCTAEGGGFPWAEDFPLLSAEKPPLATPAPPTPPAPGLFSRFTVSPAPASRFSITHVSDPDACAQRGACLHGTTASVPQSPADTSTSHRKEGVVHLLALGPAAGAEGSCKEA